MVSPVALTPDVFLSNIWASAETAGCSRCQLGWQQFPGWFLHIREVTRVYTSVRVYFGWRWRLHVSCCLLPHLWWRSPCLGNCTCNAVTPPSSSYGSWWGPGQTGVAQVTLPSPPLWTAGSLKKLNNSQLNKIFQQHKCSLNWFLGRIWQNDSSIRDLLKSISILPKPCLMYCGIVRMHDTL